MLGVFFKYANPSLNSLITFLGCFDLMNVGRFMNKSDAITAIKLNAFIIKQVPAPSFSSTIPESAGPMSLAKCTIEELRAMAFEISSLWATISFTMDCLAGTSKALITPSKKLNTKISVMV
jgi:hypothetical protein